MFQMFEYLVKYLTHIILADQSTFRDTVEISETLEEMHC